MTESFDPARLLYLQAVAQEREQVEVERQQARKERQQGGKRLRADQARVEVQAAEDRISERRTAARALQAAGDQEYRDAIARLQRPSGHGSGW